MSYQMTGKLISRTETEQVTDTFKKREFVIEVEDGTYIDYVKFQLFNDKCDLINNLKKDEMIHVDFNIKGNKVVKDGKTMFFTNLNAWKVAHYHKEETFQDTVEKVSEVIDAEVDDDLPF